MTQTNAQRQFTKHLPALKRLIAADERVLAVWLFGSLTDGYATERSDIDLAVLWERALDFKDELSFDIAVQDVLRTDHVDVVHLNRANLLLRFRAISGKIFYQQDDVRVPDLVERTLIAYRDFTPRREMMLHDYFGL